MLAGQADVTDLVAEWWAVMRAGIAATCDDHGS
jgi:hypothetical protein